jgi:hypothetical protein
MLIRVLVPVELMAVVAPEIEESVISTSTVPDAASIPLVATLIVLLMIMMPISEPVVSTTMPLAELVMYVPVM